MFIAEAFMVEVYPEGDCLTDQLWHNRPGPLYAVRGTASLGWSGDIGFKNLLPEDEVRALLKFARGCLSREETKRATLIRVRLNGMSERTKD